MISVDVTIPVVTRLQDDGDGGYTMWVYNNEDELIADHPLIRDGEMSEEQYYRTRNEILTEYDPYENGYIEKSTIPVRIHADGTVTLAKRLCLHAGQ